MTSENKLESKTEESDVPITTDTSDSFRQLLSSLKSSRKILKTLITNNDEKVCEKFCLLLCSYVFCDVVVTRCICNTYA